MDVPIEDFTFNKGQRDRIPLSVDDANGNPVALDPAIIRLEVKKQGVPALVPSISLTDPNELVFAITPDWLALLSDKPEGNKYRIRITTLGNEEMFLTGIIVVEGW